MTPFATCSNVLAKDSASVFSPACGTGSCSGCRNVPVDTAWIWTRPCSSATAGSKGRCAGPTRASTDGPRIIRWWRCWPKRIFSCTAGCAAATAAPPAAWWNFLKEALALLPEKHALRVVRADAGFFDQQLLGFLEQRGLSYIVVARLTRWLKREAARVTVWRALDEHYAVGEFSLQLFGWDRPRRFVVIREQLRAERASLGRKLLEVPGYTFRVFVTNLPLAPGGNLARLQSPRGHGKSHRRTETRFGRG